MSVRKEKGALRQPAAQCGWLAERLARPSLEFSKVLFDPCCGMGVIGVVVKADDMEGGAPPLWPREVVANSIYKGKP